MHRFLNTLHRNSFSLIPCSLFLTKVAPDPIGGNLFFHEIDFQERYGVPAATYAAHMCIPLRVYLTTEVMSIAR